MSTPAITPEVETRRYYRATEGSLLAGVCRGLANHLGVDVTVVRLVFLGLTFAGSAGLVLYGGLWIFAPLAEDDALERPVRARDRFRPPMPVLIGLAAIAGTGLAVAAWTGNLKPLPAWPLALVVLGVVLLWRQADETQRAQWRRRTTPRGWGWVRTVLGALLVIAGITVFFGGRDVGALALVLLSTLVVIAGLALISGPWWVRMARDLAGERAARIREQERAEIAAHLHDSVLHTLALIQRSVDDPREVARLTRAQERQLRTWLYRPAGNPETMLAPALQRTADEVEDEFGIAIEVVTVGDCPVDERLRALLPATREALVNAAKYAADSAVSLYAEVTDAEVSVFVRDRGPGFDLGAVPEDRLGVRHSILGRVERAGGRARVGTAAGGGTEVALELPRRTP